MQFHTAMLSARSPCDGIHAQNFPQLFRSHAWVALTRQQLEQGSYTAAPLVFSPRRLLRITYLVTYAPKRWCSILVCVPEQGGRSSVGLYLSRLAIPISG